VVDQLIDTAIDRNRTTLSVMAFLVFVGILAYRIIPVELQPNIDVPFVGVTLVHEGISPEDSKRLLVLPLEDEVRAIEGVKELTSYASENLGILNIEFEIDIDQDNALIDVREAINRARIRMPSTMEEPVVRAATAADFPLLIINFTSDTASERTLYSLAQDLRTEIEALPDVLAANISGHREELLEVVIDPLLLESYNISIEQLAGTVIGNNRLVAAGSVDTGRGRFAVKVPGLIETPADLFEIPVKTVGDSVITLGQIASIRRVFKDRQSYSYVNGMQAISLEITKRVEANLIDVSAQVKALTEERRLNYPKEVNVFYTSDQAPNAERQVNELIGNVITAMMLVMILVVGALGLRSGLLVSMGIPVSFLCSYIVLLQIGYSFNFMVMFGMLLALGMLIDGAIVIVEYADRKMVEGYEKKEAYALSARRMFWPVVASVATTLAAFLPLFLWPGVSGRFMVHLPVTVFAVLVGSLGYALIFAPTLGALFGKQGNYSAKELEKLRVLESGDPTQLGGFTGFYARSLKPLIRHPVSVLAVTLSVLIATFMWYGKQGKGVIFFSDEDPTWASISIGAQGNFSVDEVRDLVVEVQNEIARTQGIKNFYTRTEDVVGGFRGRNTPQNQIGRIFLQLHEPDQRLTTGNEVLEEVRRRVQHLAGVTVEIQKDVQGPPVGKAVQIQLASRYDDVLEPAVNVIRNYLETQVEGLRDIEDTRDLPGIEWHLVVDRERASAVGADVSVVGRSVQLVTNGVNLGSYHPDDSVETVGIRARFPKENRGVNSLDSISLVTAEGPAPISSFVKLEPRPKKGTIQRVDTYQVEFVRADVLPGILVDTKVQEVKAWLKENPLDSRIRVSFRGASEEQANAGAFLGVAFLLALLLMFVLLIAQFNSLYQAFLTMFAVVMSTAGVLAGLLITGKPFSVILTGVGIVALAGIVVNNNIVLIDTYKHIRASSPSLSTEETIIRTAAQRFRPVLLTSVTTIFGLLPIASHLSIDFINREITHGGSVTASWVPLASAIVSGLSFATLLTLLTTPAMLALPERLKEMIGRFWVSLHRAKPDHS